ncbi:MAG: PAS domain-containing protein [Paludibacter sp.]
MKNEENDYSEAKELRLKAEEELKTRTLTKTTVELDNDKLMHDLQVHQIELEMQNEELKLANRRAEEAMEKYVDLYDFAPSGYLTLSKVGDIIDLNFSAATLLGKNRIQLKNTRFNLHIAFELLDLFDEFLQNTFTSNLKESCELLLYIGPDKKSCYVLIDALVSQDSNTCLITMTDITELKSKEEELNSALKRYKELNSYFLGRELRMIDLKKEINELLIKSGCEKEYLI